MYPEFKVVRVVLHDKGESILYLDLISIRDKVSESQVAMKYHNLTQSNNTRCFVELRTRITRRGTGPKKCGQQRLSFSDDCSIFKLP